MSEPSTGSPPRGEEPARPRPHSADSSRPRPHSADSSPPRPQYGEYATPEEQRARIHDPAPWQQPPVTPIVTDAAGAGIPSPAPVVAPKPRPVDRIVTIALLAYGLVNVLSTVSALADYGAYAETILSMLGVDAELSDPAAGRPWGIGAALVLAVGWCVTAAVSVWNMRRGRLSWWIPVTGGILFTFVSGTLMLVPLMSDPAVWSAVVGSVSG